MVHQFQPVPRRLAGDANALERLRISAVIITYNEELKIEECIKSLSGIADEILVVDSCSTDRTSEICKKHSVRFISHPFEGYVAQKNFAMGQASYDYILSLDADERLSSELRDSILKLKETNSKDFEGYYVHRFNNYCGQWIRHSGWYPEKKVRLWDRRIARWTGTDPHDYVNLHKSKAKFLPGDLLHYSYCSVDEHLKQVYRFAEIAARAKYHNGEKCIFLLNVLISPLFRFVKSYFFQRGFLDGYYGFIFCATSALMTFCKYLRLYEYNRKGLPEHRENCAS